MPDTEHSIGGKGEKGKDDKIMENIKSLEAECAKLYKESTRVWKQLTEDMELQEIEQKLQAMQEKV
jgi:uncharacterized protein YprB with RNaseH-like and TPR domain